jgi:hypothetical protein
MGARGTMRAASSRDQFDAVPEALALSVELKSRDCAVEFSQISRINLLQPHDRF